MTLFFLTAGGCCLLYFIILLFYSGFTSAFYLIWPIMAFGCFLISRLFHVGFFTHLPAIVRILLLTFSTVCLLLFSGVEGMILKGTVRNVIDFGAFVDIGVHQDGLVHISQMTDRYIKHPLEAVSVGDIVEVKVLSVDEKKKRISLTMKGIQ